VADLPVSCNLHFAVLYWLSVIANKEVAMPIASSTSTADRATMASRPEGIAEAQSGPWQRGQDQRGNQSEVGRGADELLPPWEIGQREAGASSG